MHQCMSKVFELVLVEAPLLLSLTPLLFINFSNFDFAVNVCKLFFRMQGLY